MIITPTILAKVDDRARAVQATEVATATGLPGLTLVCARRPTPLDCVVYVPLVCLVLQGAKEVWQGDSGLRFSAGQTLIVSHHLPGRSRILDASPDRPYLALAYQIDTDALRRLCDELDPVEVRAAQAMTAADADAACVAAMLRLLDLSEASAMDRRVLHPLIDRELHYRLLLARHGEMLRHLARRDSHASAIERALGHIRAHYDQAIRVGDLADLAGMSPSSFHQHFKAVTATTPLQYQKDLRLIEARAHLRAGDGVGTTAFRVGYESPTQFARDYARKFGTPPSGEARAAS